jgi:hypothetical protein
VLLIVDEAQGLSHELLAEIADLSAIGMLPGRSLAVLLVGQTELNTALSDNRYADLTKRIIARCAVNPLLEDEIGEYIRHCLKTSGAADDMFSVEAIRRIASISRGAPGVINIICDRALRAGHKRGARIIGWEIIEECFGKLGSLTQPTDVDGQEQKRLLQLQPSAGEVGARRGTEDAAALEEGTRHRRVRSPAKLSVGLLAVVALVAASYSVYTGWLIRSRPDSAQKENPSVDARGPENAVKQEAPLATGAADVLRGDEGLAVSIPKPDTAMLPARRASPDLRSPAPNSDAPARVTAEKPKPAPPRGSATPVEAKPSRRAKIEEADGRRAPSAARAPNNQARERESEAPDPAAIIDWLMNESAGRR